MRSHALKTQIIDLGSLLTELESPPLSHIETPQVETDPTPNPSNSDFSNCSDSLDTSYFCAALSMASNATSESKTASIDIPSGVKLPILMLGDLTLELAYEFACACHGFFCAKDIEPKDQVKKVTVCFRDIHIVDYIDTNLKDLEKLSFTKFMADIVRATSGGCGSVIQLAEGDP
ncbi:hypothetical protein C0995_006000, partial [Termitomyces sp. Mi166